MKTILSLSTLIVSFHIASISPVSAERDLETGVFLSRDPAGFVDGPNVYAYVKQNPWTKFDPLGLYEEDFHYYAVYHVLRSNGHDASTTNRLAGFSQYIDDNSTTSPFSNALNPTLNAYHHFIGSGRVKGTVRNNPTAQNKLSQAINSYNRGVTGSEYLVGDAIHTLADTFAHEGYSAHWSNRNARDGSIRPNIGHADAPEQGHAPDRPYNDVDKAVSAAKAIYDQAIVSTAKENQRVAWEEVEKDLRTAFSGTGASLEDRIKKLQDTTESRFGERPQYNKNTFDREFADFNSTIKSEQAKLQPKNRAEAADNGKKQRLANKSN